MTRRLTICAATLVLLSAAVRGRRSGLCGIDREPARRAPAPTTRSSAKFQAAAWSMPPIAANGARSSGRARRALRSRPRSTAAGACRRRAPRRAPRLPPGAAMVEDDDYVPIGAAGGLRRARSSTTTVTAIARTTATATAALRLSATGSATGAGDRCRGDAIIDGDRSCAIIVTALACVCSARSWRRPAAALDYPTPHRSTSSCRSPPAARPTC